MNPDINVIADGVISQLKAKGTFDKFRRECLAESDSKPSYINLHNRVTTTVEAYLRGLNWTPSFPKINSRNQMRKRIEEAPYFKSGIENIVEQSLRGRMNSVFIPVIEEEVFSYMGCEKNAEEEVPNGAQVMNEPNKPPPMQEERPFQFIGSDFAPHMYPPAPPPAPPPPPIAIEPPAPPPPPEEDSDDESPMFEKIGEFSPPRVSPVFMDIEDTDTCKYLESSPLFEEKLAYYRKLSVFHFKNSSSPKM